MMRKLLFALALTGIFTACKQENETPEMAATPEAVASAPTEAVKQGHGKVELKCGSQTLVIEGICGGNTASGDMIVAAQDKNVPAKVFTISFNGKDHPQDGKTYHVRKSDFMSEGKKPSDEVYCGFSEITQANQRDWSSDAHSGTLQFTANGNEITCKFSDLKLQPSEMYNKGEFNAVGTVSGEMTFYKN